mmetsp:Transcript_6608/g.10728  ORF Transcript_6608/g.10728 Transcript_6608/m.10728 type:complete len:96 (-) Transcript_6608:168-455(-)
MPDRVNNLEIQKSQTHLSQRSLLHSLLLSDSPPLSKLPSLSNMSTLLNDDDDRIDRFSENYYRAHWGLHKTGLVLGVFLGLIVLISVVVGMAYVG